MNTNLEKIPTKIFVSALDASLSVAHEIANLIKTKQKEGKKCVIGLATGSSPTKVYEELVRLHVSEKLSFYNVYTFNLDEYYPMQPNNLQSYVRFMNEHLFNYIDIPKTHIHIPDGTVAKDDLAEFCKNYEKKIEVLGGLDLQIVGIGRTGHIGFNEPGSNENTVTRLVTLDQKTRIDAASDFFGEENVPRNALTMGVGTIIKAKKIIMMAWGESKAKIIKLAIEGQISEHIPSTFLQKHSNTVVVLDQASASELTQIKTPWLVTNCDWSNQKLLRKAVVWLSQKTKKSILKLTNSDYMEYGMSDLISVYSSAYQINIINLAVKFRNKLVYLPYGKGRFQDIVRGLIAGFQETSDAAY